MNVYNYPYYHPYFPLQHGPYLQDTSYYCMYPDHNKASDYTQASYQTVEVIKYHNPETYYFGNTYPLYAGYTNQVNQDSSANPKLEGEDYLRLKRELKERKKLFKTLPRIVLNDPGEAASISLSNTLRVPLFINDIQNFIVYTQTGHTFYKPRWCNPERPNRLNRTFIMLVEGLSSQDYAESGNGLTAFNDFEHKLEFVSPGCYKGNIAEELSMVPVWPSKEKELMKRYGSLDKIVKKNKSLKFKMLTALFPIKSVPTKNNSVELPCGDKFSRKELLLSAQQMVEENYPVPLEGSLRDRYKYYVKTKDEYQEVTPSSPLFAVDCEMCLTEINENELTRISIVNEDLDVVYDTFVKPYNEIRDYLTKYSGVSKEILDPVTVRLEDVQKRIRELLPQDAILVGQSLNCDLHAMKMMHPYIIDTSVIFNMTGVRSRKTKLVTLSQHFLSESIQQDASGHCSTEDSAACMKLVKLKLANSLEFGDAVFDIPSTAQTIQNLEREMAESASKNTEDSVQYQAVGHKQLTSNLLGLIASHGKKIAVVGNSLALKRYNCGDTQNDRIEFVNEESGRECLRQAQSLTEKNEFVLCHIKYKSSRMKKMNHWTKKLYDNTPPCGLFVVILTKDQSSENGACFLHLNSQPPC